MHLVVERPQRLMCPEYARKDYLVVPYYSPVQASQALSHPTVVVQQDTVVWGAKQHAKQSASQEAGCCQEFCAQGVLHAPRSGGSATA